MPLPNFLIIGTGRSGTTSLYHYLAQHPQIYMSPLKEPRFLAFEGIAGHHDGPRSPGESLWFPVTTMEAYRELFSGVTTEDAIGEASPMYLRSRETPRRIHELIPDARLIAVLRNPVERGYSSYVSNFRDGRDPRSFEEAVAEELTTGRYGIEWGRAPYLEPGFYARHLTRYLERFDRGQLKILFYEDFCVDGPGVVREILRFLEVDDAFVPDMSVRYNMTGLPKSRLVHRLTGKNLVTGALKRGLPEFIRRPTYAFVMRQKNKNLTRPEMPAQVRAQLIAHFREDILALQDLLGRDLSAWMRMPEAAQPSVGPG